MADTGMGFQTAAPAVAYDPTDDRLRSYSVVIYILYLLAVPSVFSTMLLGVAIAYWKQNEARGTVFESHLGNAIDIFWVALVVGFVALALWPLFFLGAVIHAGLFVWIIYRTIRGLVLAVEARPYA